jgi:hypothetical protein
MSAHFFLAFTVAVSIAVTAPGLIAQSRTLSSKAYVTFERKGADSELIGLAVGDLSPGMKITVQCTGPSCPFEKREMNISSKISTFAMTDLFVDPVFKPGTTLEIRITKAGSIGRVFQYETRSAADPKVTELCLPPDASRPVAC